MRWFLLLLTLFCVAAMVVVVTTYSGRSLRVGQPMLVSFADNATRRDALAQWLVQHRPDKVSADNELLRRRRLAALVDLAPGDLELHTPAVLASLSHSDGAVRRLALPLLERLVAAQSAALAERAASLTERLGSADGQVRLAVVQALPRLWSAPSAGHQAGWR